MYCTVYLPGVVRTKKPVRSNVGSSSTSPGFKVIARVRPLRVPPGEKSARPILPALVISTSFPDSSRTMILLLGQKVVRHTIWFALPTLFIR